jgi:hypothetical protein
MFVTATSSPAARVSAPNARSRCSQRAVARAASSPASTSTRRVDDENENASSSVEFILATLGAATTCACGTNADGVRGLFASRDVRRGETLLEASLDAHAVVDDPSGDAPWSRQLARRLVEERRRASTDFMRRYVSSLPQMGDGPAIGLANDARCVEALRDVWDCTEAVADMTTFARQIEDSFALERALDSSLSEDEWRWAVSLVHSRTFRLEDERGRRPTRRALVAGADLINHSSVPEDVNCDWVANDADVFVISATKDVRKGEEFFLSYGEQCDRHFALFYGFLPRRNSFNRVKLFNNGREALDWYRKLCGADAADDIWNRESERVVKMVCDKYGKYTLDEKSGLRRRVIQDLYLGEGCVVSHSMLLLFNEMCGDEEMAIAAIRTRAEELKTKMVSATGKIETGIAVLDAYSQGLVRDYRSRKIDILDAVI